MEIKPINSDLRAFRLSHIYLEDTSLPHTCNIPVTNKFAQLLDKLELLQHSLRSINHTCGTPL